VGECAEGYPQRPDVSRGQQGVIKGDTPMYRGGDQLTMTDKSSNGFIQNIRSSELFPASLCFIISLLFYMLTMMPGIGGWGDSARFQFFGKILGTSYPTGYPLYMLIDNVFSHLPFWTLAYRINFMSGFFAATTLFVLFIIINSLIKNKYLSFFSTMLFGFSHIFWSQAIIAEVYTLNSFFMALLILTLIKWVEKSEITYLFLASYLLGLSLGNHLTMILIAPAFLYIVLINDYRALVNRNNLLIIAGLFLAGISLYLYVFIRSLDLDAYIEMRIFNFNSLISSMSGGHFRKQMFCYSIKELLTERFPFYLTTLISQFTLIGYIIGLYGICCFLKDRLKLALFLILLIICNLFYSLNYNIFDIDIYFIPTFLVFAMFIGYGLLKLNYLISNMKPPRANPPMFYFVKQNMGDCRTRGLLRRRIKKGHIITFGLLSLLLFSVIIVNYVKVDLNLDIASDNESSKILELVEDNSIIITQGYEWTQYYLYKLIGENRRKGANLFILWCWTPVDYVTPYLSSVLKQGNPGILIPRNPQNEGKSGSYPYLPEPDKLRKMNIYLHKERKEPLEKINIPLKRVYYISCYGSEEELYKIIMKPEDEKLQEKIIELRTPVNTMPFYKELLYRLTGNFKLTFWFVDRKFLRRGWSKVEYNEKGHSYCWAQNKVSELYLPVLKSGSYMMTFRVNPFTYDNSLHQSIKIFINGNYLEEITLENTWKEYTIKIPPNVLLCKNNDEKGLITGNNLVEFRFKYTASPYKYFGKPDLRQLAVAFEWIKFRRV